MDTLFVLKAGAALALALFMAGAAAQRMDRPTPLPPGHSWVNQAVSSGSFGSGQTEVTSRTVPVTYDGRNFTGVETAQGTLLVQENADWYGMLGLDGKLALRWDPAIGYDWPLEVGKVAVRQYQVKLPGTEQLMPMEHRMEVEAFEEVTVPAGTFKAFRVRSRDSLGSSNVDWYSPDLRIWVKRNMERTDKHPAGPGRRELVLKSQTIRAQ